MFSLQAQIWPGRATRWTCRFRHAPSSRASRFMTDEKGSASMKYYAFLMLSLASLQACEPALPQPGQVESEDQGDGGVADGGGSRVATHLEGGVSVSRVNA